MKEAVSEWDSEEHLSISPVNKKSLADWILGLEILFLFLFC